MSFREAVLAFALVVAAGLVVRGVLLWSEAAAYVVAGVLMAALAVLFFTEAGS